MSITFKKIKLPIMYIITILNILIILVSINLIYINPVLIKYFQIFIQLFITSFLIYKFHPFKTNYSLNKNDNVFIFGSAMILLTNLGITQYTETYLLTPISKKVTNLTKMPIQTQLLSNTALESSPDIYSNYQYDKNEYHITI